MALRRRALDIPEATDYEVRLARLIQRLAANVYAHHNRTRRFRQHHSLLCHPRHRRGAHQRQSI